MHLWPSRKRRPLLFSLCGRYTFSARHFHFNHSTEHTREIAVLGVFEPKTKTNNHGRSLFIWQGEIHSGRSDTAIDFTICEKCRNRCGCGCEVYSFGNIHHIQIVIISDHSAFFQRYSIPSGTSAISSKQFLICQFGLHRPFGDRIFIR